MADIKVKGDLITSTKEKGNPERNKQRKRFLDRLKKLYGKWYAYWVSFQTEDVEIE